MRQERDSRRVEKKRNISKHKRGDGHVLEAREQTYKNKMSRLNDEDIHINSQTTVAALKSCPLQLVVLFGMRVDWEVPVHSMN